MKSRAVVIVAALAVVSLGLAVYLCMNWQKEAADRDRLEQRVQEERRRKEEEDAQRQRHTKERLAVVRPLLPQCGSDVSPRDIRVRGKVWVWDETSRSASGANSKLPAGIRGEPGDADLTVFVVTKSSKVQVAAYRNILFGGEELPGYRLDLDVCAIDAVTKQPLGKVTVEGSDPPQEIKRSLGSTPQPIYGETDEALARWIAWRPRLGRPDRLGDVLHLVPECRRLDAAAALRVRSRILIWDQTPDLPDRANEHLPSGRRGKPEDTDLTVVVVTGRRVQFLGDVGSLHTSREKLEVCVIDAARNKAVGTATVEGAFYQAPRDEAKEKEKGILGVSANWIGDRNEPLAKWVADLPREEAP